MRLGRPVRLGAFALIAVVFAGCSGGDNGAKVEANLRHLISASHPGEFPFPIDAGPPRVRNNSCKDRHVTTKGNQLLSSHSAGAVRIPEGLALWSCVVTNGKNLALGVLVLVKGNTNVVAVMPGKFETWKLEQYNPGRFDIKVWARQHGLRPRRP